MSPGNASQSSEEVDAAGHRLTELSDMPFKGELPVEPDTQEYLEGIPEHSFYINGDVGLPGRFCTVHAEYGHIALGCIEGQCHQYRPSHHFIYHLLYRYDNHVLIAGKAGFRQIISVCALKGFVLEVDQDFVYVDCEGEGERSESCGRHYL